MKKIFVITIALFIGLEIYAQDISKSNIDTIVVAPIVSPHLQGARKATEEEKEYARQLAEERNQHQTPQNLQSFDEYSGTINNNDVYYPYWNYGEGFDLWRLHKGLNVNLSASVFANLGRGYSHSAGFTQDVSLMYVTDLSPKATLAIGGYINNVTYSGSNYTTAGVNALFNYRFNDHWSAYFFVQKAFNSGNFAPWAIGNYAIDGYAMGLSPMYWGSGFLPYMSSVYGMPMYKFMDRIGGGVSYQWGKHKQNSLSISVEYDRLPNQNKGLYDFNRYSYPVR